MFYHLDFHKYCSTEIKRGGSKERPRKLRRPAFALATASSKPTPTKAHQHQPTRKINQSHCCCDLTLFTIITISFVRTHFLYIRLFTWMLYVSVDCNQNALWPCFIFSHYYFYCYCSTVGISVCFPFVCVGNVRRDVQNEIFRLQRKVCARSSW